MSRTFPMPDYLDADGQQLWQAFMIARDQASAAKRALRTATPAMRRTSLPGRTPDPEIVARYQAAGLAADEAEAARRSAERAYHAYSRTLAIRRMHNTQRASAQPIMSQE